MNTANFTADERPNPQLIIIVGQESLAWPRY